MNELQWIDFLKKRIPRSSGVLKGIGDDCALVEFSRKQVLLKSDLFIEDVHFKRNKISYKTIGMRAVARVLSDFAACGGVPRYLGVSAGIPAYVSQGNIKEILSGILSYVGKYKFSIVGGDTARTKKLFLDIWGAGEAKKCILRSTAKIGDSIFVSGKIGARSFTQAFEPRIKEAQYLTDNFKINAMIDVSDGFMIDLYRLIKESKKGALLEKDKIPVANDFSDVYRGEDYELIFTVDKHEPKIDALRKKFFYVGRIMSQTDGYQIKDQGKIRNVEVRGYTHF